jgi:cytidyltransferase-like protein
MKNSIVLYSGSFDPFHVGHYFVANMAFIATDAKLIVFEVSTEHPIKGKIKKEDLKERIAAIKHSVGMLPFAVHLNTAPKYLDKAIKYASDGYDSITFVVGSDVWQKWGDSFVDDFRDFSLIPVKFLVFAREGYRDNLLIEPNLLHKASFSLTIPEQYGNLSSSQLRREKAESGNYNHPSVEEIYNNNKNKIK